VGSRDLHLNLGTPLRELCTYDATFVKLLWPFVCLQVTTKDCNLHEFHTLLGCVLVIRVNMTGIKTLIKSEIAVEINNVR